MPLSVEKKFLRLIMLLQKSAHPVCKAYFETIVLARAEYKGDLKTFLSQHKHDIYHLVHKIKCCQCSSSTASNTYNNNKHKLCGKQLKKIYADTGPTQGHVQSAGRRIIQHCICGFSIVEGFCIDNMDLSTVNAIIQACVQGLDSSHIMWLNKILEKRNELCHIDDLDSQTERYMDNSWDYIKKSVLGLAKNIPPEQFYMKSIESGIGMLELAEFQQNDVTPILNSMKEEIALISETIRSEMKVTMMDASKEIKEEISGNANKIIDTIKEKDQKIDMMGEKLDTINKAVEEIKAVLNVEWSEDAIISDDEKDVAVCFHFDIKPPCSEQVKAKIIQEIRKLKIIAAIFSPYKIVWTGLGSIVIASLLKKNVYANKDDFESSVRKFLDTFLSVSGINCHSPCTIEVKIRISEGMPEYFENSEETESLLAKYFNKEQQVVPEMINSSLGNRETLLDQLVFLNLIINKENLSSEVGGDKKGGNKKILLIADRSDLCILQQITQLIESTLMTRITEVDIGTVLLARTDRDVDVAYAFIANSYSRRTTINAILELIQCPKRIDLVASDGLMYVMSPTEFIVINENESWKEIFMSSILAHYTASVTQENQSLSSPDKKTFNKDVVKHQIEEDKRGKNAGKIASSDKRTEKEQTQLQEIETAYESSILPKVTFSSVTKNAKLEKSRSSVKFIDFAVVGNMLVFTDYINKQLVICMTNKDNYRFLPLTDQPWAITKINSGTVAITLPWEQEVSIVDLTYDRVTKRIIVNNMCYGIVFENGYLYVGVRPDTIQVIDLSGNEKDTLSIQNEARFIAIRGERLYYSSKDSLHCCNLWGTKLWQCQDFWIDKPRGLTVDEDGNLFIVGYNGFVVLVEERSDGPCISLFSDYEENGIKDPSGICYDAKTKTLIVSNEKGSFVRFAL